MMSALFREEALENQRERLWGDVLLIQPLSFYLITGAVVIIVSLIGLFLIYGTYARRENVSGYLVPDRGLVKIFAEQPGIVTKTYVKEGIFVNQGDKLYTVSTRRNTDQSDDVDALILLELEKSKANIEDKLAQQSHIHEYEKVDFEQRSEGLTNEIEQFKVEIRMHEKRREVSQDRLDSLKGLLDKEYVAELDYKELQERFWDSQLRLEESKRLLIGKQNQLTEILNQRQQLPLKASIRIADLRQSLAEVNQKLEEIKGRRVYTLRAPTAGRVTAQQALAGQAVKTNTPLLAILPENSVLQAELFLPTRAVGFVKPGQKVLLLYSAFPYQRFGLHEGKLTRVTQTILSPNELPVPVPLKEPVYRVIVKPNNQVISAYGREFPLQAGMLLKADIILDERSLGKWLLDPLYGLKGRI
jgi:membrane fusion protein